MHCEFCRQGLESLCPEAKLSGFTVCLSFGRIPTVADYRLLQVDGSFQQYAVSFVNHLSKIPDGMKLDDAAPILCAGVTVYKALKQSNAKAGNWVAVRESGTRPVCSLRDSNTDSLNSRSWRWLRTSLYPVRKPHGSQGHCHRCEFPAIRS
jgi:hypothetical protein